MNKTNLLAMFHLIIKKIFHKIVKRAGLKILAQFKIYKDPILQYKVQATFWKVKEI